MNFSKDYKLAIEEGEKGLATLFKMNYNGQIKVVNVKHGKIFIYDDTKKLYKETCDSGLTHWPAGLTDL